MESSINECENLGSKSIGSVLKNLFKKNRFSTTISDGSANIQAGKKQISSPDFKSHDSELFVNGIS
uniref:Uncharacterized protein n=1 Tax=Romanomermis culicivorax TaxID=13658 RepID=A0A915JME3_ROMCU